MSYYIRNHYINQDDQVRNFSKYLLAMGESVSDSTHIKALVLPALTTKIDDREMFMKVLIIRIIMSKMIDS